MKISFIILHYITTEDTIKCVNSILNLDYKDYNIVIIDNASPNESGKLLCNKYRYNNKIHVILSEKNLGFAKGNNMGFIYAKYKLNSNFVVMLNNDTIIKQQDFCNRLIKIYKNENYYVLGPDIISLADGGHQNPFRKEISSKSKVMRRIIRTEFKLVLNFIGIDEFIKKIVFRKNNGSNKKINKEKMITKYYKGVLHGSCMIFSPLYLKEYDGLYNGTFMYGEEEILFFICKKLNLKYLYHPDICIYHKESSSVNKTIANKNNKQRRFFYRSSIESYKKLYNLMNENKEYEKYLKNNNQKLR